MAEGPKKKNASEPRSPWRLLFWEALAALGLYWMWRHPLAPGWQGIPFRVNALFFLVAYPLLFILRWSGVGGFFGVFLGPVGWVVSWLLGASCYLWAEYAFLLAGLPYAGILRSHWALGGILFIPLYFLFLQKLIGTSRLYYTMEECLALGLWAGLGGGACFFLGRFLDDHIQTTPFLEDHRFVLWLALIWLGSAAALLIARKRK